MSQDVRAAAYYRLHWLWPILARPGIARALRWAGWGLFAAWLAFAALVLALRYGVLPKVADYRAEIEQAASRAVGQPVRIGRIEARWQGLNPDLILDDVVIADRFANPRPGSYTATLTPERVREKIEEEAEELIEAEGKDEVTWEVADLLYFMNVLMHREGVTWGDVLDELDRRHKK